MRGGSAQQTSSNPGERAKTIGDRFCEASNAEREPKKRAGERRAATFEAEGEASKKKSTAIAVLFFLERCLPLRASDVAFGSDVHCVSDVSPYGEVGKHHITLHRRCNTSLCVSTTSLRRSRNITLYKQPKVCYNKTRKAV